MALKVAAKLNDKRSAPWPLGFHAGPTQDDVMVLAYAPEAQKVDTIRRLMRLPVAGSVGGLSMILGALEAYPGVDTKVAVCRAVQNAGPDAADAAEYMAFLFDDSAAEVRYEACLAFACMGGSEFAERIVGCLGDASAMVRHGACTALGQLGFPAFADDIAALLTDSSLEVQGAACLALATLNAGQVDVASVTKRLADPRCRMDAFRLLDLMDPAAGQAQGEALCPLVCECLGDADEGVRHAAALAMGRLAKQISSSRKTCDRLAAFLLDDNGGFRIAAALAVGYMGRGEWVEQLQEMLSDDYVEPAANASTAGGRCTRPVAERRKARCAAAVSLGRIVLAGGKCDGIQLAQEVAKLLDASDWEIRAAACDSLGSMGSCADSCAFKVTTLFGDPRFALRARAAAACGKIGASGTAVQLLGLLEDKAPSVRIQALLALPNMGKEFADRVCERLVDSVPEVRVAAISALLELDQGDVYASAIAQKLSEEDEVPIVRVAAIEALGKMGSRGALYTELIAEQLEDPAPQVREAANRLLQGGGLPALRYELEAE